MRHMHVHLPISIVWVRDQIVCYLGTRTVLLSRGLETAASSLIFKAGIRPEWLDATVTYIVASGRS